MVAMGWREQGRNARSCPLGLTKPLKCPLDHATMNGFQSLVRARDALSVRNCDQAGIRESGATICFEEPASSGAGRWQSAVRSTVCLIEGASLAGTAL